MEAHTVHQGLHLPTGVWLLLSLACTLNNGDGCMHEASEGMLLYCTTPTRLEAEIYMAKRESKCECQKMMHVIIDALVHHHHI